MIDKAELRIGNYHYRGYQTPEHIEKIKSYFDIGFSGFMFPIPITEDILYKCGFYHDNYLGAREGNQIKVFKNDGLTLGIDDDGKLKIWNEVDDYWYNYFSPHPIESLHELQNIYYWLSSKKELEVKL